MCFEKWQNNMGWKHSYMCERYIISTALDYTHIVNLFFLLLLVFITNSQEGRYAGGSSRSHSGSGSHSGSSKGPVPNSSAAGYTNRQSKCTAPAKTIPNGKRSSFNINHFKIGSVVRYWCESGYAVKGGRYLKCVLRNGKGIWAGNIPTCVKGT